MACPSTNAPLAEVRPRLRGRVFGARHFRLLSPLTLNYLFFLQTGTGTWGLLLAFQPAARSMLW